MKGLIALDIDGTLVGPWGGVRPSSRQAIDQARAAGMAVVLATGRRVVSTLKIAAELSIASPLICYCGARVVEPDTGRERLHQPLPGEMAWDLLEFGRERGLAVCAFADEHMFLEHPPVDYEGWGAGLPLLNYRHGPGALEAARGRVLTQVAAYGQRAVDALLAARAPTLARCQVYHLEPGPGRVGLQILDRGVDKASALAGLCRDLAVPRRRVLAVGDSSLDAGMLAWAGTGVAMPDSDAAAREAADRVASPGDPDPVAAAIRAWLES